MRFRERQRGLQSRVHTSHSAFLFLSHSYSHRALTYNKNLTHTTRRHNAACVCLHGACSAALLARRRLQTRNCKSQTHERQNTLLEQATHTPRPHSQPPRDTHTTTTTATTRHHEQQEYLFPATASGAVSPAKLVLAEPGAARLESSKDKIIKTHKETFATRVDRSRGALGRIGAQKTRATPAPWPAPGCR